VTDAVRIVFETHSLTIDNERGAATGWLGGRLSARGRVLAEELGARRREDAIDAVFVSDLARAVETAEVAFGGTNMPVTLDWRLREIDYGELNGAPVDVIEAERAGRIDVPFPGGESYRDAVTRVAWFLDDAMRNATERARILLIGHTATRWGLDHLLDDRPLTEVVTAPFGWREGWDYGLVPGAPVVAGAAG
jgi:2,3-bisphosphoglycerate-dependent phosphoglycerate mutase